MWLRHHLLYTKRGRRRQAPQALAPATGSGPRLSLQLTRLCDMRFPFVLAAVVSAAGFAACAGGARVAAAAPGPGAAAPASPAVRPGRFDAGKMGTFDTPPLDYFQEAYAFRPDSAWLARARLGALRFATYCSDSFVSPHGLVLTNHHCSRENTGGVMRPGENFDSTGFYAPTAADERRVPGLFVEQLLSVADVTARMDSALRGVTGDEALARARDHAIDALGERLTAAARDSSVSVQIVSLYEGAQYSAYTYRRYGDVRLVLVPELGMGFFGGDDDNFTYPRYDLDFSVYRVYDASGKPLETPSYFRWSRAGTSDGDAVFVVGNPGSTSRLETVAQLEYTRDVQVPATLDILKSRIAALEAFSRAAPAEAAARSRAAGARGAPPGGLKEIAGRAGATGNGPAALERLLAAAQFQDLKRALGERDTPAAALFAGRTADQAAADLLSHTALSDSARVPALFQGDLAASGDAAFLFARRASRVVVPLRQEAARLSARADNLAARLARVRFDVYGKTLPPDATLTLRLADGVVRGYPYNGTRAVPFTTFYGMYDRYAAAGGRAPWSLPPRWQRPPAGLDLATPLDLVLANDIIRGNSGSPLLNRNLELVGLVFHGHIESVPGDFIFTGGPARALSVD